MTLPTMTACRCSRHVWPTAHLIAHIRPSAVVHTAVRQCRVWQDVCAAHPEKKTEICHCETHGMHEALHMRMLNDRYWHGEGMPAPHAMLPDTPPPPQIPRLPPRPPKRINTMQAPGLLPRMPVGRSGTSKVSDEIDRFRRIFYGQASGLLDAGALPIPPGHPLYDARSSVAALEAERDVLLKENADLKMRLEGRDNNNDVAGTSTVPHALRSDL